MPVHCPAWTPALERAGDRAAVVGGQCCTVRTHARRRPAAVMRTPGTNIGAPLRNVGQRTVELEGSERSELKLRKVSYQAS